jgi:hypothetical protein
MIVSPDALVIANGFSCREQIIHNSDHKPMHLAQVIQMGLQQSGGRMAKAESVLLGITCHCGIGWREVR